MNNNQCYGIVKNTDKMCSVKCNDGYFYCKYHYKQKDDEDNFLKSCNYLIKLISNAQEKENKILISKKMFDFCLYNKKLINTQNPSFIKFKITLFNKFKEFVATEKSFEYYLDEKLWENNYENTNNKIKFQKQYGNLYLKIETPLVISTNDIIEI